MYKWYVLKVIPGHENKVKRTLEDAIQTKGYSETIPEVLLLTEQVTEVKRGKQRTVEKRLWAGYLLVRMKLDDESWSFIKQIPGVKDFALSGDGKPSPLSEEEISHMVKERDNRQKGVVHYNKVQAGDQVKIIDGSFATFHGKVTEVDPEKGLLKVLVSIFGREAPVTLELWQVEPHTGEDAS